jgi:DNA-binding MarR family transcriptional regulator
MIPRGRTTVGEPDPLQSRTLLPELANVPGHLFWRAAARVGVALSEVLPAGVDIHAYAVLLALATGEARSQQWLADTVSISRTTMTKVAAELAEQGLVERIRNAADRRSYSLTRTPEGAAAARRWRRHAEDVEEAVTAGFAVAEREELRTLLLRVAQPGLSTDTPDALLESIPFLITRIHFRMHAAAMEALRDLGIEPRHIGSLVVLDAKGPMAQAELARQLGVSGASVVEIADHLERVGLVERRRLETDRRTQVLHLLPQAGGVVVEGRRRGLAMSDEMLSPLGQQQRRRLTSLLGRIVTGGE